MSKYNIEDDTLREEHAKGGSNREIAKALDVPHWFVAKRLLKIGLKSNIVRGKPPEPVDENHSLCSKCNNVVKNEDFPWLQGKADGRRLSYCRKCRYLQYRLAVGSNPTSYWKNKQTSIKRSSGKRGGRAIEFSLPDGYLEQLWYDQGGRCFYTDAELELVFGEGLSDNSPSVDRVDNSLGYIEGNVVICTNRINSIKRDVTLEELRLWMPGWYDRLLAAGKVD